MCRRGDRSAPSLPSGLFFPERMYNEQHHRNRDAGVGNIKGRPGMCIRHVQIEKKKINHVPVKKTIGKISQDSGEKKCQRKIPPTIRCSHPQQEPYNNHERNTRNDDEERIVTSEGSKRCAVVGHVNKTKKIRYQNARLIRTDEPQNQL